MSLFKMPNVAQRLQQIQVQEKGNLVRARLVMPNGKIHQCVLDCSSPEKLAGEIEQLDDDSAVELGAEGAEEYDELGGFLKKLKKAAKKVGKVALAPVKIAHKYTHQVGPIAAMHKKVQEGVAKALPITKPFIKVHNSLASPVHKAIEGKKIKNKLTAKAIADVTKDIPAAQKGAAQAALVAKVKEDDALKSIGKAAAKAKVIAAAKTAAKKGDPEAKKVLQRAAAGTVGTYKVVTPSGRTVNVPAAKVAHS